ncbi:hypothetical protein BDV95DRAFT_663072 [Massariosphaeria phaeospora]|uniref:Uncharacterized protein n=1 Tax=Massariosphaeria phaeospora TaxID=100035 RepID=A0A7C8MIL9_9PLEO|nr:hypothetical protein BDV95DRAFT_663072 [Massariosphaeria phaeospora]
MSRSHPARACRRVGAEAKKHGDAARRMAEAVVRTVAPRGGGSDGVPAEGTKYHRHRTTTTTTTTTAALLTTSTARASNLPETPVARCSGAPPARAPASRPPSNEPSTPLLACARPATRPATAAGRLSRTRRLATTWTTEQRLAQSRSQPPNTCWHPPSIAAPALRVRKLAAACLEIETALWLVDSPESCTPPGPLTSPVLPPHSSMDPERPQLSITLPRNFMFHYQDGQAPRTPEPEVRPEEVGPPPLPRQTLKVRRRRTTFAVNPDFDELDERTAYRPIPTIETPEPRSEATADLPTLPSHDSAYLSPAVTFGRLLSPPKTPIAQMRSLSDFDGPQHWSDMDPASQSETSSRPTSSSGFSDSSMSSRDSFDSFPSLGGSCTSPEDDMADPFSFCLPEVKYGGLSSPLAVHQPRLPKKLKLRATFTEEMDYHLWMTYMRYLQDPTVTPFKALPSTVPPNGVCHRVARMARKTWRGSRTASSMASIRAAAQYDSRCGTPDTIKPPKSGSSTPVPGSNKPYARYPTEKQCRKRLRDLAKQKPTLSAHYQRLLRQRSPSPLQSSPQASPRSSHTQVLSSPFSQPKAPSFSTRDMNVSLATSTAASMQFGNPLQQLASNASPRPTETAWPNTRSSAHQKSQSLHIGLGIGNLVGSSFQSMSQMTDMSMNQSTARTWHAPSGNAPKLGSPLRLHAPKPISRPFKRRALHNFEEQARSRGNTFVDQLFGAPAKSSHRRVRSRGFSLGDMGEGARRLPLSTTGPPEFNPFADLSLPALQSPADTVASDQEMQGQSTIRLGSPFVARPNHTFPRASASHAFELPASFEQRFAGLPSDPALLPHS